MLKKFGMQDAKLISTPMSTNGNLDSDFDGKIVNQKEYRSLIGSLLYVTASRPDVMFSVCMCARYQASPRESHLTAAKRILRYLKQTRDVGLWYPKGSKFELIGYSDSDYGVARSIERAQVAHVNYLEDHLCHGPQRNKIVWQSLPPKPNM
jgi:hypothetical protein